MCAILISVSPGATTWTPKPLFGGACSAGLAAAAPTGRAAGWAPPGAAAGLWRGGPGWRGGGFVAGDPEPLARIDRLAGAEVIGLQDCRTRHAVAVSDAIDR